MKDGSRYDGRLSPLQSSRVPSVVLGLVETESLPLPSGDFKAGKKHGQGTMKYANGHSYVGGWESDVFHGRGDLKGETDRRLAKDWLGT